MDAPHRTDLDGPRDPFPGTTSTTEGMFRTDVAPVPPPRPDASVADLAPRPPKGGRGLAGVLGVSLLSAVLASAGTAAAVPRSPAAPPAAPAPTPNAQSVQTTTGGTEDITGVVANARESVVTITVSSQRGSPMSPFDVPTTGVGSGVIVTTNG